MHPDYENYIHSKLNDVLLKSFGVPQVISEHYDTASLVDYRMSFSMELELTEAGKQYFKRLYCENFDGIYDGVLHVYSRILGEWMPIGN